VFDQLTRYHDENRVHIEGWKSNDYFFINKRVVLPNMCELKWDGGLKLRWEKSRQIDDMERALAHLSGLSIFESINKKCEGMDCITGQKIKGTFFTVRAFKKGTMHFYFNDLKLLEKFNLTVGRLRGWLPKQDKQVPKEFWLINK